MASVGDIELDPKRVAMFRQVVLTGSLAAAARGLAISPSAMSQQIAHLEDELGVSVFIRQPGRRIRLTPAGEILARHAEQLALISRRAVEDIRLQQQRRAGSLLLGAGNASGTYLAPLMLAAARRRLPELAVSLRIANTAQLWEDLQQWRLDAALISGALGAHARDCAQVPVGGDQLVVIAPSRHAVLAPRRQPLSVAGLRRHALIVRETGSTTRTVLDGLLGDPDPAAPPWLTLDSHEAIKQAVLAGLGLGIVADLAIGRELADGSLATVAVEGFPVTRPLSLVWLRHRHLSLALDGFIEVCRGLRSAAAAASQPVA